MMSECFRYEFQHKAKHIVKKSSCGKRDNIKIFELGNYKLNIQENTIESTTNIENHEVTFVNIELSPKPMLIITILM